MTDRNRSSKSNEDLTKKISHSIFVTNFPDSVTSRDLWRECNAFGTVVDVFIPFKKSKAGKRFAFVRFIKVFNLDRLVKNLCTIWIGRHHLYANQVRFERPQKPNFPSLKDTNRVSEKSQFVSGSQQSKGPDSYVNVVNGISPCVQPGSLISPAPAMVLDDSCIIEQDFRKLVMLEFNKEESKSKLMQHTGVKSWFHSIQDVTHDFVCDERIVWVNIEGIPGDRNITRNRHDPFGIYDILKKKKNYGEKCDSSTSLSHPPGFTPEPFEVVKDSAQVIGDNEDNFVKESSPMINAKVMNNSQSVQEEENGESGHNGLSKGGSVLGVLEEMIRVGQAMGYSMEGCEKDIESIIRNQGDDVGFR
ncbi:RNA-directed DNA polymerase, eukaryota, nucleotide-binding alpha-beta plait domain protein [Tanacetum coccineum]